MRKIEVEPIGIVKNKFNESADPFEIKKEISEIIINAEYEDGLFKLEESEYIDVLFHFHLSDNYKLVTNIYTGEKKGVFASRSPKRPSSIGNTTCKLLKREGNKLTVTGLDALNNTPVLDIKPADNSFIENENDKINFSRTKANPRINILSAVRSNDLEKLMVHAGEMHGHYCPGLALGVLAGSKIMKKLADDFNEQLNDFDIELPFCSCPVDGIQYVTGCTTGNKRLNVKPGVNEDIIVSYKGKQVFKLEITSKEKQKELLRNVHPYFDGKYDDVFCKVNLTDEEAASKKQVLTEASFELVRANDIDLIKVKEL